jgi:hypothetical protein
VRNERWHESSNPTVVVRGATWRGFVWVAAAIGFILLVLAAIWGIRVATSDVRGEGDATVKVNSADNRLFAQGNFHDLYEEIKASDRKLDQAAADKAAHPGDAFYETNYTGLKAHCQDTVAQYNAAAKKVSQAKFRDEDLPAQIDGTDPATDCQETK